MSLFNAGGKLLIDLQTAGKMTFDIVVLSDKPIIESKIHNAVAECVGSRIGAVRGLNKSVFRSGHIDSVRENIHQNIPRGHLTVEDFIFEIEQKLLVPVHGHLKRGAVGICESRVDAARHTYVFEIIERRRRISGGGNHREGHGNHGNG